MHVAGRDGALTGTAVIRDEEGCRWLLDCDLPDGDGETARGLMSAVAGDGRSRVVVPVWNPSRWLCHVLADAGFRMAPDNERYLVARWSYLGFKQPWLHQNWQVMAADIGLHPLPPFTLREAIVHPPPAGTAPSRS